MAVRQGCLRVMRHQVFTGLCDGTVPELALRVDARFQCSTFLYGFLLLVHSSAICCLFSRVSSAC
jgi:hypothetical protein